MMKSVNMDGSHVRTEVFWFDGRASRPQRDCEIPGNVTYMSIIVTVAGRSEDRRLAHYLRDQCCAGCESIHGK